MKSYLWKIFRQKTLGKLIEIFPNQKWKINLIRIHSSLFSSLFLDNFRNLPEEEHIFIKYDMETSVEYLLICRSHIQYLQNYFRKQSSGGIL